MIIRKEKTNNPYIMVTKGFVEDISLSWKAKGLLLYMLSKPDDWKFYEEEITKNSTDGIKAVKSGIKELIERGYIKRQQLRKNDNKFNGYEYIVHENCPLCPFRTTEKGTLLNNKETKLKDINIEYNVKAFSVPKKTSLCFDFNILANQIRNCYNNLNEKPQMSLDHIIDTFDYFMEKRSKKYGLGQHPKVSNKNITKIIQDIDFCNETHNSGYFELDNEVYQELIDEYFYQDFNDCDYSIVHFMSGDIRSNCYYKTMY